MKEPGTQKTVSIAYTSLAVWEISEVPEATKNDRHQRHTTATARHPQLRPKEHQCSIVVDAQEPPSYLPKGSCSEEQSGDSTESSSLKCSKDLGPQLPVQTCLLELQSLAARAWNTTGEAASQAGGSAEVPWERTRTEQSARELEPRELAMKVRAMLQAEQPD